MEGTDVSMDVDDTFPKRTKEVPADVCNISNREFAENVQHCKIVLGKGAKPEAALKPVNAVLNSGGGIVQMKIDGFKPKDLKDVDTFWSKLQPKLDQMVQPSAYTDVFDQKRVGDTIFLFVKAVNHFCTVDYNLHLPGDAGVLLPTYNKVVDLLSKRSLGMDVPRVPVTDLPVGILPETFTNEDVLNFHESKQVQFKCFRSKHPILHSSNHEENRKIERQISAFGNGNGGMFIMGVTDNGEVQGQSMNGDSEAELKNRFEAMIEKMSDTWSFIPRQGVHWDIKFFPVAGAESRSIIVILIAGMQNLGGIFRRCPVSFELVGSDGEDYIIPLDLNQWKKRILHGTCVGESKGTKKVRAKFSTLSILKGPLLTLKNSAERIRKAFLAAKPGCPVSPEGFEENQPEPVKQVIREIQQHYSRGRNRSLLVGSRSWLSCITKAEIYSEEADGTICDLLLFDQELGGLHLFTLCTSGTETESLSYAQTTAKVIKRALVVNGGCYEKFYISYHLVSCTAKSAVPLDGLPSPDDRYPVDYQLETPRGKVKEVLKSLVIVLAKVPSVLSNKQGISFFNLLTVEQFQLLHHEIERHKELWINGAAGTGKTLVAVEFIKELRRRDPKLTYWNIVYVCENLGLRQKISKLGICQCVCRRSFMMMSFPNVHHVILDEVQNYRSEDGDWLEKARTLVLQHCPNPRHDSGVVSDYDSKLDYSSSDSDSEMDFDPTSRSSPTAESSFQVKTGQHEESARNTTSDSDSDSDTDLSESRVSKPRDTDCANSGRGSLWIFIDRDQVNHNYPTGIPDDIYQQPTFYLTKVIRNSKRISNWAKRFLSENSARQIEMGHDFDGEEPIIKRYTRGEQMAALKEVLLSLLTEGYSERDIAILYGKEDCIPERKYLCSQLNLPEVVDAYGNDSECVLVSTFRKYSGLERPLVILVNIAASLPYRSAPNASIYCAITRAMVKVVSLEERKGQKRKHQRFK